MHTTQQVNDRRTALVLQRQQANADCLHTTVSFSVHLLSTAVLLKTLILIATVIAQPDCAQNSFAGLCMVHFPGRKSLSNTLL